MGIECDMDLQKDIGVTFSQAAHMILTKCSTGPNILEHIAMKAVLVNNLPLEQLPRTLQLKAEEGMFTVHGLVPQHLTPEGRLRYNLLKLHYDVDESGDLKDWDGW